MPDIDDRLQQYISQIEAGIPKEQVLDSLKDGEQELAALIKLADAMRTISHPIPAPAYSRASKQKIISAVPKSPPKRATNGKFQLGWLLFPSLTGAVALLVVMFITFGTLGVWLAGPASADVALTADIEGVVEVASAPDSADWTVLSSGESVRGGQYLRTSPGSSAVLLYSDGSRTHIGPETQILLRKIDGTWDGDIRVRIEQTLGETVHNVISLSSQDAYYTVITPAGEANVRGTSFKVNVETNGVSRVVVENGKVLVKSAADEILVPAGQATLLQQNSAQEVGNYFSLIAILETIQGKQWSINGQTFQISNQTLIQGSPEIGQVMQIEGRILANGRWIADAITPLDEAFTSSFTGIVDEIASGAWIVNGKSVIVNETTQLMNPIDVGDSVEVHYFALEDGDWLALQILGFVDETLAQTEESKNSEPISTNVPTMAVEENENRVVSCQQDQTQTDADRLSQQFGVSYEEIMVWYCSGYGFGEIELAYSLSTMSGQPVYVIFNLNNSMTWNEINAYLAQYQLAYQTSSNGCPSVVYKPKAQQLADKYGITIEEVISLLCQGNTYSTVDLTLSLAQEYNLTPAQILEMKKNLNWGQLKKTLRDKETGKPDKEDNPNKPDKEDNPNKPQKDEGF